MMLGILVTTIDHVHVNDLDELSISACRDAIERRSSIPDMDYNLVLT
jgi:hypothetical protein